MIFFYYSKRFFLKVKNMKGFLRFLVTEIMNLFPLKVFLFVPVFSPDKKYKLMSIAVIIS